MGIVNRFRRGQQQPKYKVGDAVVIKASPHTGYPTPLHGRIHSIAGVDSKGNQWYKVEPIAQHPQYGPGKHSVTENEIQPFNPTYHYGDEVQGVDNPGGRGTVLNDSFIAPDGREWVKIAWPDGSVTYEKIDDVEIPDDDDTRTEGTARPIEHYQTLHGQNPKANTQSIGGSYPSWIDDFEPPMSGQATAPSGPTKDQLSDRIYDITQSGQPEQYEGELQDLLNQWQQVVGTPQPRFLGGSK